MPSSALRPTLLKLLFSNAAAGVVIGRGGSNRELIQRASGARLKLSKPGDYHPGTSGRVQGGGGGRDVQGGGRSGWEGGICTRPAPSVPVLPPCSPLEHVLLLSD